ncbi:MAG: type II 3-dehydroquinate dehydratase [Anaerolineae bacterium]|nr:type II 3-dehydroquinate dehydratase [Anaerolineae bacterium]MBT7072140.1 type II 3-dehydroquinate dehydratase [Anaerolineae bacterium]MBT7990952.1 type II 3-dehydroquinate dehydratase [Anaerolineae bacterium]
MTTLLVLHGPNLNLLGSREPEIYGALTLADINKKVEEAASAHDVKIYSIQSNHEGALIDALQEAANQADGVIFNPAGYTHTSVALRDTVATIGIPVVEVHLSNVYAREEFRQKSLLSAVCAGKISGFGWMSYKLALEALVEIIERG